MKAFTEGKCKRRCRADEDYVLLTVLAVGGVVSESVLSASIRRDDTASEASVTSLLTCTGEVIKPREELATESRRGRHDMETSSVPDDEEGVVRRALAAM